MDKKAKNKFLIIVVLLTILEIITLILDLPWEIKGAVFILLNVFLAYNIFQVIHMMDLTNEQTIKLATTKAITATNKAVNTLPVGVIAYDESYHLKWANPYALLQLGESEFLSTSEGISQLISISQKNKPWVFYEEQYYQIAHDEKNGLLYFQDVTRENDLLEKNRQARLVVGIISLDNYDDATDKMDEKQVSYLNSFLTTYISDWMNDHRIFYKRINSERYFFSCQYEALEIMIEKKFDLLDIIRKATSEEDIPITVSMGVAYGAGNSAKIGKAAQNNLDMALVRGGDQVVLTQEGQEGKPQYFGGKTSSNIKRTRVRSRAIGTALGELLEDSDAIFIMVHNYPDMDAIGSAVGVATLARFHEKQAWIVLDPKKMIPDVEKALKEIRKYPELAQLIITPQEALQRKSKNSLLVMVDYNRPSLSISPEVSQDFEKIVIIDHHRRGEEFPKQPLLVYLESSASSASELVAELIDFASNRKKQLTKIEATLLYSGMVVDTKSFKVRTTSKTFDVASYLKGKGADLGLVEYLLSSDLASYLEMSRLISKSEYLSKSVVLVCGSETHEYDPVTSAKAADTLLGLQDIHASFVITKRTDGQIGISARSDGSINVQVIMEDLGGGGHFTNAAVQLTSTVSEAREKLIQAIEKNEKENE